MKYKNTIRIGSTRTGKTMAEVRRLVEAAEAGASIVAVDPHEESLASAAFAHLVARGFQRRILYDRTSNLRRCPGYDFLAQPAASSPLEYRNEADELVRAFADLLCRRREMASLATSPQTEEFVIAALTLYISQFDHPHLTILNHAFGPPDHPDFQRLLRGSRDEEVVSKFREIQRGSIKRAQFAPAERLIRGVCGSPMFGARCGASFNLASFLDHGGILIIEGDGTASDAVRTIMGAIIMLVLRYVRTRPRRSPPVILALDEANNAGLIGASGYETRAAAETQKMGLAIDVLVQSLDFPTTEITNSLMTNCLSHYWYYSSSEVVIRKAVADLGSRDYEGWIRSLKPGECVVKDRDRGVFREYKPMLEDPWGFPGLAAKKAKRALVEILQRPEYRTPRFVAGRFLDDTESHQPAPAPPALPHEDPENPNLGI